MIERYKRLIEDTIAELERVTEGDLVGIIPNVHAIAKEARRRLTAIELVSSVDLAVEQEYADEAETDTRPAEAAKLYKAGSSLVEIGGILDVNPVTVRKWVAAQGAKIRSRGNKGNNRKGIRDRERVERIRQLREEGKTMQKIGTELCITRERVRQIMVREGISTEPVLTPEQVAAVRDYIGGVESLRMVARRHGASMMTLRGWLTRAGYDLKPNDAKPKKSRGISEQTKERAAKAAELYKAGMKIDDIGRELGVMNAAMVYRYLDYAQVPRDRRVAKKRAKVHVEQVGDDMPWTIDRIATLKDLWAEGKTAQHIADTLGGVTRNAVIGKINRLGLQRSHQQPRGVTMVDRTTTPPSLTKLESYWLS